MERGRSEVSLDYPLFVDPKLRKGWRVCTWSHEVDNKKNE